MGIPQENILNLNKSRMRAVYWRQVENGDWVETTPLPADPTSVNHYFLKGFKAKKPEGVKPEIKLEEVKPSVEEKCPTCGFVAKSVFGLNSHLRKHAKEKNK